MVVDFPAERIPWMNPVLRLMLAFTDWDGWVALMVPLDEMLMSARRLVVATSELNDSRA